MHIHGRSARVLAIVAMAVIAPGCIVLPIPATPQNEVTAAMIGAWKVGVTTRADILMTLGDPTSRLRDDRVFVYDWLEARWVVVLLWPTLLNAGGPRDWIAIEFFEDGTVSRVGSFVPRYSEEERKRELQTWMEQSDPEVQK